MKSTFENLKKLNSTINKYCTRNMGTWLETKQGCNMQRRWNKMMEELRGWAEFQYDDNGNDLTKPEWIEYCEKTYKSFDHTFGDICA